MEKQHRGANKSRRTFLRNLTQFTAGMSSLLSAPSLFAEQVAGKVSGVVKQFFVEGKHTGLTILNDRPVNAETPAHLLDEDITSAMRLFVRNNGIPPTCLLYTSPSPRDRTRSRMPSSA